MSRVRWLLVVLPMALWGGVFVAVKAGEAAGFPPLEFAAARAFPAGVALAAVAAFRRTSRLRSIAYVDLVGMAVTIAIMFGITFEVARRLPVAIDALLANASPLFAVGLAALFLREPISRSQIAGTALGALGVVVMALPGLGAGPSDAAAMMEMLLAAFSLALNTIFMKRASAVDPVAANAFQLGLAGALLFAASLAFGEHPVLSFDPIVLTAIAYVSLVATAFGYVIWMWSVTILNVARASIFLFLVPVFGLLWGWSLLRETITAAQAVGSFLVVTAIVLSRPRL